MFLASFQMAALPASLEVHKLSIQLATLTGYLEVNISRYL